MLQLNSPNKSTDQSIVEQSQDVSQACVKLKIDVGNNQLTPENYQPFKYRKKKKRTVVTTRNTSLKKLTKSKSPPPKLQIQLKLSNDPFNHETVKNEDKSVSKLSSGSSKKIQFLDESEEQELNITNFSDCNIEINLSKFQTSKLNLLLKDLIEDLTRNAEKENSKVVSRIKSQKIKNSLTKKEVSDATDALPDRKVSRVNTVNKVKKDQGQKIRSSLTKKEVSDETDFKKKYDLLPKADDSNKKIKGAAAPPERKVPTVDTVNKVKTDQGQNIKSSLTKKEVSDATDSFKKEHDLLPKVDETNKKIKGAAALLDRKEATEDTVNKVDKVKTDQGQNIKSSLAKKEVSDATDSFKKEYDSLPKVDESNKKIKDAAALPSRKDPTEDTVNKVKTDQGRINKSSITKKGVSDATDFKKEYDLLPKVDESNKKIKGAAALPSPKEPTVDNMVNKVDKVAVQGQKIKSSSIKKEVSDAPDFKKEYLLPKVDESNKKFKDAAALPNPKEPTEDTMVNKVDKVKSVKGQNIKSSITKKEVSDATDFKKVDNSDKKFKSAAAALPDSKEPMVYKVDKVAVETLEKEKSQYDKSNLEPGLNIMDKPNPDLLKTSKHVEKILKPFQHLMKPIKPSILIDVKPQIYNESVQKIPLLKNEDDDHDQLPVAKTSNEKRLRQVNLSVPEMVDKHETPSVILSALNLSKDPLKTIHDTTSEERGSSLSLAFKDDGEKDIKDTKEEKKDVAEASTMTNNINDINNNNNNNLNPQVVSFSVPLFELLTILGLFFTENNKTEQQNDPKPPISEVNVAPKPKPIKPKIKPKKNGSKAKAKPKTGSCCAVPKFNTGPIKPKRKSSCDVYTQPIQHSAPSYKMGTQTIISETEIGSQTFYYPPGYTQTQTDSSINVMETTQTEPDYNFELINCQNHNCKKIHILNSDDLCVCD